MSTPIILMPEQVGAIAELIKDKVALTAENARLRGELEYLTAWKRDAKQLRGEVDALAIRLSQAQFDYTADLARVSDEYERVEHDRSNLLCEREELRDRLRNVCGIAREAYKPNDLSDTEQLCAVLTTIISACASPAPTDLARVTVERDALLTAAQATIDTFEPDDPHTEPTYNTPRGDARAALRMAVAACAPPASEKEG